MTQDRNIKGAFIRQTVLSVQSSSRAHIWIYIGFLERFLINMLISMDKGNQRESYKCLTH